MSEWVCNFAKLVNLFEFCVPHLYIIVHLFIQQTSIESFPSAEHWPGSWRYNGEED